ncbi:hypothetical protein MASR1M66_11620 [Aminivibrio sp.]
MNQHVSDPAFLSSANIHHWHIKQRSFKHSTGGIASLALARESIPSSASFQREGLFSGIFRAESLYFLVDDLSILSTVVAPVNTMAAEEIFEEGLQACLSVPLL